MFFKVEKAFNSFHFSVFAFPSHWMLERMIFLDSDDVKAGKEYVWNILLCALFSLVSGWMGGGSALLRM